MITTGGNGSWTTIEGLLKDIRIPRMVKVRQNFLHPAPVDVEVEITRQFTQMDLLSKVKPGDRVAITIGSRGITGQVEAAQAIVRLIKSSGGVPFLIPAMGSHAGATAEGQKAMLEGMGYTEGSIGAPILSSMETIQLGVIDDSEHLPVLTDQNAYEADHLIVMNRIKPHVCFRGPYESGLMKMITIGLGKQKGAEIAHNRGFARMPEHIPRIGVEAIRHLKILCAVGLVENAFCETAICRVLRKDEITEEEPLLLEQAKSYMPRICFDELVCLIIDEIGKNISGAGFDTNIVGRYHSDCLSGGPRYKRVAILDIAQESKGNGNGLGMADFTTKRAAEKFDFAQTYPNTLTALLTGGVKIPMVLPSDKQTIQACMKTSNLENWEDATIVRVRNTLFLTEIEVSENLLSRAAEDPRLKPVGEPYELAFDEHGNLF